MARLIDSSVFVALERWGEPLYALEALVADAPFAMASISASELLAGLYRTETIEQRERRSAFLDEVFNGLSILPFDLDVARTHARVYAELRAVGQLIGPNDLIIAATAITHGYDVLTYN
ncbi:MAG: PIN domain-containing protein, partial [Thermomicrobiales bacterium]